MSASYLSHIIFNECGYSVQCINVYIFIHVYINSYSLTEKLKTLAVLLRQALFISDSHQSGNEGGMRGKYSGLQRLIMTTMIHWAQQPIQSPELIQQIFTLLYRQCDEISEVVRIVHVHVPEAEDGLSQVVLHCLSFVLFDYPSTLY